ncbi:MAG: hypothetical protein OK456_11540 [Thaumarchaeota archaeon]|nr:hypothetical protein [Nitrososphaerota archaeon]
MTLSAKAWRHIRERHPELANYRALITDALLSPEVVLRGQHGERKAVKLFTETHLGSKYLVVVYRDEPSRKNIITAYFTSDLKRIKGESVWRT